MKFGIIYQFVWGVVSFVLSFFLIISPIVTDVCAEGLLLQEKKAAGKAITIVLDPGHGGRQAGAIGPGDIKEKDVALSLARAVKKRLSPHYHIVLTRTDDYWIGIEDRAAMANHYNADLFISIHTGGSFRHRAGGLGTFYWSGEVSKGLHPPLTAPEKWNTEEASLAWERIQERHLSKSRSLAVRVHKELLGRLNTNDRGCQAALLYVLAGADMPAILVEVGYVTNPTDEKQLASPVFLDITAEGLSRAITDFLQEE
jgi:N-acetylmuramoyl-L-alanine amidase